MRRSMLPAVAFVTTRSESVVGGGGGGGGGGGVVPLLLLPPPQPQVRLQSSAHTSHRRPHCALCISVLRPSWTANESSESSRLIGLVRYIAFLTGNKGVTPTGCNQSSNIVRGNQGSHPTPKKTTRAVVAGRVS